VLDALKLRLSEYAALLAGLQRAVVTRVRPIRPATPVVVGVGGAAVGVTLVILAAMYGTSPTLDGTMQINGGASFATTPAVTLDSNVPTATEMRIGPAYRQASVGAGHTLAITDEGTLWTWGTGTSGQLGEGKIVDRQWASQIGTATTWAGVIAGANHSAGLRQDGTLYMWGSSADGKIGDGTSGGYRSSPVTIGAVGEWKSISLGTSHTLGIKKSGALFGWGRGAEAQLGENWMLERSAPWAIAAGSTWTTVCAGDRGSIGIKTDGTLWTWGQNLYGELGLGHTSLVYVPTKVGTATNWVKCMQRGESAFALKSDGTLWAWGLNNSGQLGLGDTTNRLVPTQVPGTTWADIVTNPMGYTNPNSNGGTMALKTDGSLWAWGLSEQGSLARGSYSTTYTPSQIGTETGYSGLSMFGLGGGAFRGGVLYMWGRQSGGDIFGYIYNAPRAVNTTWTAYTPSMPYQLTSWDGTHTVWTWYRDALGGTLGLMDTIYLDASGPSGSVVVNAGQSVTNTTTAWADSSVSNALTMQIYGGAWAPYSGTASFTLSPSEGTQTVTALYKDEPQYSRVLTLTTDIVLDTTPPTGSIILNKGVSPTRFRTVSVEASASGAAYQRDASAPTWTSISMGYDNIAGIRSDGTLWSTGPNAYGSVGDGSTVARTSFVPVKATLPPLPWKQVSTGTDHSLAIAADNTLWAWGGGGQGQIGDGLSVTQTSPVKVGTYTDWKLVRAGHLSSYALRADGSLYAWGMNSSGQLGRGNTYLTGAPFRIGAASDYFKDVMPASGGTHTLGIKSNGTLWAWGTGTDGQVGDATGSNRTAPVSINTSTTWTSLAAGGAVSGAVKGSGPTAQLYLWGSGWGGAMGDGTFTTRYAPAPSGPSSDWVKLSIGSGNNGATVYGLKADGTLWSWGNGYYGQLGSPTAYRWSSSIPARVGTRTDWADVSLGREAAAARTTDGQIWAWGRNDGRLGMGTSAGPICWPTKSDWLPLSIGKTTTTLTGGTGLKTIGWVLKDLAGNEATVSASIFLDADTPTGTVTANGGSPYALTASIPATNDVTWAPTMRDWPPVSSVALGGQHAVLTFEDGTALGAGFSYANSYAIGPNLRQTYPAGFTGLHNWKQAATGDEHTLLLAKDGTLWSVGRNSYGQLGLGNTAGPVSAITHTNTGVWQSIASGGDSSAGIKADGSLYTWGTNCTDRLNHSTPFYAGTGFTSVALGYRNGFAVKSDGSLWGWGDNSYGDMGNGVTGGIYSLTRVGTENSWVSVRAGSGLVMGLKSDGSLWTWGYNGQGQLGVGSATSSISTPQCIGTGWSSFAAGANHALGVKADGTLWAWGYNVYGQLGLGDTTVRNVPVQVGTATNWGTVWAGSHISYAAKADGTLWAWGMNYDGELSDNGLSNRLTPVATVYPGWATYAPSTTYKHFDPAGATKIGVSFRDAIGNVETIYDDIIFDLNRPVTSLVTPPSGWSTSSPFPVPLAVLETESGVQATWVSLDGVTESTYTVPVPITAEGTTTLSFRSVDKAGNAETTKTAVVQIDTAAPVTATGITAAWRPSGLMSLTPTDVTSGVQRTYYRIGSSAVTTYTVPFVVPEGVNTVRYWSTDSAGNSEVTKSVDAHIDLTAPSTSVSALPTGWVGTDVPVSLSATDGAGSGVAAVKYTVDGGAPQVYSGTFAVTDGTHVLRYWSEDFVGNSETTHTATLKVDTTPPSTGSTSDGGWHGAPVSVSLTPADVQSGVSATYYSIDGGPALPYSGALSFADERVTKLEYWSVDAMGNVEPTRTVDVKLDYTVPISALLGVPSGVATSALTLSIDATDSASGVATSYYRIGGGQRRRYLPGQTAIVIAAEGTTTVDYWSVDVASNAETPKSATVRIRYPSSVSPTSKNPTCVACHGAPTGPRRVRLDFSVGDVDRATACPRCHVGSLAGTHPFHNATANCGAFCHIGWGSAMASAIPNVSTAYGAFVATSSATLSSDELHVLHASARWPATADKDSSRCGSCHAQAACDACHSSGDDPVDAGHAVHSATGNALYPAVAPLAATVVGYGVPAGDQTKLTTTIFAGQCATTKCHNVPGVRATDAVVREDYSHPANAATGLAANTVVTTGTWKPQYAAGFSSGRLSFSTTLGATHAITFTGQRVSVIVDSGPNRGIAEVYLDGVLQTTFDAYATTAKAATAWESGTLGAGTHTITVKVKGTKNAKATTTSVAVDYYRVWPNLPRPVSPLCSSCHPAKVADHGYGDADHVADGGSDIEPISGATCSACHSMDLLTEHERVGSASKGGTCITCHEAPRKSFASWNQSCQQGGCHTPETTQERHAGLPDAHDVATTASCTQNCHETGVSAEHGKAFAGRGEVTCVECHNSTEFATNARAVTWNKQCTSCHPASHAPGIADNSGCFECHGATATAIDAIAGVGTYAATGGDHESGYAGSAHGSNVAAGTNGGAASGIQCEACHTHNDIGRTGVATSFRGAATAPQSELCFECHSASGDETRTATPNTWNGRDIAEEFSRVSHHPVVAGSGSTATTVETVTVFAQSTVEEFSADAQFQTSTIATTGAGLWYGDYVVPSVSRALVFFMPLKDQYPGVNPAFSQYDPLINRWNWWGLDPTDQPSPLVYRGQSAIVDSNTLVWGPGTGDSARYRYTPPDGAGQGVWSDVSALPFVPDWNVDTAIDAEHSFGYYVASAQDDKIYKWRTSDDTWATPIQARDVAKNSQMSLSGDTGLAYSPETDRLYLVEKRWNVPGRVLWTASPSTAEGVTDFTDTGVAMGGGWGGGIESNTALELFSRGGHDFLFLTIPSLDGTGYNQAFVVGGLASGTHTAVALPKNPFWVNNDNPDLAWDGGDYLYEMAQGTPGSLVRIRIPVDPINDAWGAWEFTTAAPGGGYGTTWGGSIACLDATPAPQPVTGYRALGTYSAEIDLPAGATAWGQLAWDEIEPASTAISLKVEAFDGSDWSTVAGMGSIAKGPMDLSAIDASTVKQIRLTATLTTVETNVTPALKSWSVTAVRPERADAAKESLTCANCHNSHLVATGGADDWDLQRVSNPRNTKLAAPSTVTDFCLTCHTTTVVAEKYDDATVVPYNAAFRDFSTASLFAGWSKNSGGTSFRESGHFTTAGTKALCENCHDPHGSDNRRLAAWTAPTGWSGTGGGSRDNTSVAAFEQNLCFQCHGNGTVGWAASGAPDIATPMARLYRHDTSISGVHEDTETAADNSARHAECTDCHNPHAAKPGRRIDRTAVAQPALLGASGLRPVYDGSPWSSMTTYTAVTLQGRSGDVEALVCLKCHTSASGKPNTVTSNSVAYTSTDLARDFNPANLSYHNVFGLSVGMRSDFSMNGTAFTWALPVESDFLKPGWKVDSTVTCSDCHSGDTTGGARGPHGAATRYMLDSAYPDDWKTARLTNSTESHVTTNIICLKCHVFPESKGNSAHWARGVYGELGHMSDLCISCHISVPHGWKRPRLLAFAGDPAPYTSYADAGRTALKTVRMRSHTAMGWSGTDCRTGCSGYTSGHYDAWPADAMP